MEGFRQLYIHDVPLGEVLNSSTADSYSLRATDCWISDDNGWLIDTLGDDGSYRLIANKQENLGKLGLMQGTLDYVLSVYKSIK